MKWPNSKIGEVCDVIPGFAFKSSDLGESGIPVVKIGDITDDYQVDLTGVQYFPQDLITERHDKFKLRNGDIVIAMTGATAGKVGRIRCAEEQTLLLNQRVAKFRPTSINPNYFGQIISTPRFRTVFHGLGGGAAQPNMSGGQIESVEIPCPPLHVQQRIADILTTYDDLIESNRRRMALLEEAARQLYREWFVRLRFPGHEHTRITNGVPEGWEKENAFSAMEVLSGGTPKTTVPDYWDGEIPFYTPKDASDAPYALNTERSISELGLKNCNSRFYDTDTVFISARGTVGKLNLAARPMAMSQSCYALVGRGHVSQLFLFCALKEAIEHFKQHAVGAVFDAIVVDTFKLIPFMVPSERMVNHFEQSAAPMFRQISNLLEQNERLRAARDLLLPRLMSGEISV